MAKWEELPIYDRAQYMRIAVQNGYRDIRSIREAYNKYAEGGPVRVHKNKSSTAKESTILEDRVAKVIANTKEIDHRYDIPYIEDKEMKINGIIIPTNALDSIAKYAGKTNTPLDKAIALGFESGYGRQPYFNYGQEKVSDRAIGNMNYFKNYGAIPAHLFVRDYEYIKGGYNNGKPYYDQDPLEHSMNYLNSGRYNTKLRVKDKDTGRILNHDQLLEKLAKQLNQDSNYLLWKKQSGLKEYSGEAEKERTRKKAHETYKTQHPFKAAIKDLFGIEYAEGGTKEGPEDEYNKWLENEARLNSKIWEMPYIKALDQMKNDRSYDYRKFYELQKANPYNPEYQRDLKGNAHYSDIGKSVYHPTASTGSYYSGRKDPKWNPTGAKFGEWLDNNHEYRLSDDMLRAGSNPYETFDYLGANENRGVRLRDERGLMFRDYREPEETYIGGVLPSIIVKAPRKH